MVHQEIDFCFLTVVKNTFINLVIKFEFHGGLAKK